ncbi:unnamed protein product [Camellia sinensis]
MAVVPAIILSISTLNLHFQANWNKGLGLDSRRRRRRRLNSLVSITRSSLLHPNAPLLESAARHTKSVGSASEAVKAGIPLDHYQDTSQIDFAFNRLQGEESVIQEKNTLKAAEKLVFIVTEKQYKSGLEGSIPVLIKSFNWMETVEEIEDLFLGDAEVCRRPSIGHAGPTGCDFPLITREGHNVLGVLFTLPILNLVEVANTLDNIDGVVDHGVISKIPQVPSSL